MLAQKRLLLTSIACFRRHISTSNSHGFKFKLTEEISEQYEQEQKKKKDQESAPTLSKPTLESSILMGKVSSDRYQKVIKIGVPKHRMNQILNMWIRETDNVYAYDEHDECKPGDWVIIEKKTLSDPKVTHQVKRVTYKSGNWVDPITGRRAFGIYYDDDLEKLEKIKIDL